MDCIPNECNCRVKRLDTICCTSNKIFSLLERTVERELLPMARKLDLAVTPWAVIGGGILSGKYNKNKNEQGRAQINKSIK